jgi:hypothetical protein
MALKCVEKILLNFQFVSRRYRFHAAAPQQTLAPSTLPDIPVLA